MSRKRLFLFAVAIVMLFCFAGCEEPVETIPPNETVYDYTLCATSPDEITALEQYPNLTEVDFTGSTCYAEIFAYMEAHPEITVIYDVQIGQQRYPQDTFELTLEDGSYDLDELIAVLPYLPKLQTISLPKTQLTADELHSVIRANPDALVTYSVMLFDSEIPADTQSLDLSWLEQNQVQEACSVITLLPNLRNINLVDSEGTAKLGLTDVRTMMDALPDVSFAYNFELFGQQFTTESERMEFVKTRIGNEGAQQLREALDIMPKCTYLKVDRCVVDSEVMAEIREDYPNVKVVWRVFFGMFNCLTDEETLRLTNGLKNHHIEQLKYCNDAKYLDIGHNDELSDISFIKYMPKLEIVILSGSIVSDLSPFQDHQNIEFLELCFCMNIADISPLANCPNLKYLNISFTKVKDISATENLPMGRFVAMGLNIDHESQQKFLKLHPDCLYRFEGQQCYGYAWRYDDYGYTYSEYYANMRKIFDYDNKGFVTGQGIYNWGY